MELPEYFPTLYSNDRLFHVSFFFPVDAEQYELAAKLSEKYLDFQILVVICDKTNNQARLDEYIERYKEYDFSQFAISWHMRQNKQGDIFHRFKGNQAELARFLSDHPSLAWIQLVFNGELAQAADVLLALAQNEKELLNRKRVMLSLSKLCALAAEGDFSAQITEINSEVRLLDLQEQIPVDILNIYGYDIKNAKVLSPEEIVDVSSLNMGPTCEVILTILNLSSYTSPTSTANRPKLSSAKH